jgi:hypothetical protein
MLVFLRVLSLPHVGEFLSNLFAGTLAFSLAWRVGAHGHESLLLFTYGWHGSNPPSFLPALGRPVDASLAAVHRLFVEARGLVHHELTEAFTARC